MRDFISREYVIEHLSVDVEMPHHDHNLVRTLSRSEQVGNVRRDLLDFLVSAGQFINSQRVVGRERLVSIEQKQFLKNLARPSGGFAKLRERPFRKRLVVNEPLPCPFGELR